MSCVACRVLRKGCSDKCPLRSSLSGIEGQEAQGYATVFLSKFFGRAGLTAFCSAVPEAQRPALFQSLLYEACGRTINPVYGSVGLLWSGKWHLCQAAVEKVLSGGQLGPADRAPLDSACAPLPSAKPGQAAGMLGPSKTEYGTAMSTGSRNGGSHSGAGLSMFDGGLTGGMSLPMHPETMRLPLHSDSMRVSVHSDPMRVSREQTGISLSPPGALSGLNPILMGLQYRDFAQPESRFGAEVNLDPVVYQASPPLDLGGKLHAPNLGGFDSNRYGNGQHFNALRTMVPNRGFPL